VPIRREEYRIREMTEAEAPTIEERARTLEIDPQALVRTVTEFNAAVSDKPFTPAVLDGKDTGGITPPKSNWAQKLDTLPYVGFSVTCGITFTFGRLRVDPGGQVQEIEDRPIRGLYAAGGLVGGLFYHNYPGGAGLMAGSVLGQAARESATADIGAKAT
jgi:tricarballylate dehydrogenase